MERNLKITIPEPCHENWNKMTPNENGRFCMSCSKTVIDFTSMLPEEIQHFFIQNQSNKICGRFKKSQLDSITIQIPNRILYSQTHYSKMFLLALFIAMGTTLFSCQNKDGKKQKIDKVEVVTDTVAKERIVVGETPLDPKDTAKANVPPPPPPPKVDQVKFVNSPINTKKTSTQKSVKINCEKAKGEEEDDVAFVTGAVMQTNAEFPGGIEQFYNFFAKEFKQPENISDSNLKIRIAFAVEKNGSMSFLQADPAIDKSIENEIIRVLKSCPKWQPGESNGKKIRIQYSLPITLQ